MTIPSSFLFTTFVAGATGDATQIELQWCVSPVEFGMLLEEQWQLYLSNVNIAKYFALTRVVEVLADDRIGATADHSFYMISATTGGVEV